MLETDDSAAVAASLSANDSTKPPGASSDLTLMEALETALASDAAIEQKELDYVILNDLNPQARSALGLPDTVTITNESLLRIRQHARDLQPRLICLSRGESFDFLHKSNADLQSATALWRGHDIVWLVVSPRHSFVLETRLNDYLGLEQQCSQYIRHEEVIIPPSILKSWNVDFSVFVQVAGEMITTDYQAYHYAWRLGANLTETMILYDSVWVWPPKYEDCKEGNWKCETSRSLVSLVNQSMENLCVPSVEVVSHEQTTNNALESPTDWSHEVVEVVGDQLSSNSPQRAFAADISCSPPHEDTDEGDSIRPAFQPTVESHESSRGTSVEAEVKTIPSDGFGDVQVSTTSTATQLQSQRESTSPPLTSFLEHARNFGAFNPPHINENASDSASSSQNLFLPSPSRDSIVLPPSEMAELRNVSPDSDHVMHRPHIGGLRLPPPAPTPVPTPETSQPTPSSVMPISSVGEEDNNLTSVEEGDEDSKDGHGNESVGTETSDAEPGSKPQTPAMSPETSQDNEILTVSETMSGRSPHIDTLTISDSPLSERHRLKRKNDPIALTPERAVRLRRLESQTTAKQTAEELEELVQLGTLYQEQIVWKTVRSEDAERTLSRFRPGEWLTDDAIMETLYRLTSGRDDVHVVHSLDFAAAYAGSEVERIRRWTDPAIILIPVYLEHQCHWLLVSVHFGRRRVTIHDRGHRPNRRLERFLSALFSATQGWNREYQNVSQLPKRMSIERRHLTSRRL